MTTNHKQVGAAGETIALEYLVRKGYTLVEKNFRVKFGELDLIVKDPRGCLVIVEVKTDTSGAAGTPESWVTGKKIHQINKVAGIYVALRAPLENHIRFDVVSVVLTGLTPEIRHFENAFLPVTGIH